MTTTRPRIPFPVIKPPVRAPIDPPFEIWLSKGEDRTWMPARPDTAGQLHPTARHHAPPVEARCNSSSLAADPSFPRSRFAQAVLDVTAVVFAFLFVSVTALAIVGALFILLFVRL